MASQDSLNEKSSKVSERKFLFLLDNWRSYREPRRSGESWQHGAGRGRGRGRGGYSARRTEADYRRADRGGRKEDRALTHQASRSSPPPARPETAAASSGGHEPRPGTSRGSPPRSEASRKKSRLESPGSRSSEAPEVTKAQTVTKKKKCVQGQLYPEGGENLAQNHLFSSQAYEFCGQTHQALQAASPSEQGQRP